MSCPPYLSPFTPLPRAIDIITDHQLNKETIDMIIRHMVIHVDTFLMAKDPDYNDFSSNLLRQQFLPK